MGLEIDRRIILPNNKNSVKILGTMTVNAEIWDNFFETKDFLIPNFENKIIFFLKKGHRGYRMST